MTIKFDTREYSPSERHKKDDAIYEQWHTPWLCPDGDSVELYLKREKRFRRLEYRITELSFNPFSGFPDYTITIDDIQAPYARTLLNLSEIDELRQWLGIADAICKKLGNEEI